MRLALGILILIHAALLIGALVMSRRHEHYKQQIGDTSHGNIFTGASYLLGVMLIFWLVILLII